MRPGKNSLLLIAFLLVFSGCAALRPHGEAPSGPPEIDASSVRARAVVELRKGSFSAAGRAAIFARAPGSFRIEVFGPFGQAAALIASDGEKLLVDSGARADLFPWGDPEIPYSFEAREAVSFLTGSRAALSSGGRETRDPWGRLLGYARAAGDRQLKATLGEYREVAGAHIPFFIRIEDGERELVIKYTDVEVNPLLEDGFFELEAYSDRGPKEVD